LLARFFFYLEANVLASAPLPSAASYLLASFPKLFGSAAGLRVLKAADARGWPLAWGFGSGLNRGEAYPDGGSAGAAWAGNRRMFDPRSPHLEAAFNVSTSSNFSAGERSGSGGNHGSRGSDGAAFEDAWRAVAAERAAAGPGKAWSSADLGRWWALASAAAPPSLRFEPLLPGACGDPASCVGLVFGTLECICHWDGQ